MKGWATRPYVNPPVDGVITYYLQDYPSSGGGGINSLVKVGIAATIGLGLAVGTAALEEAF
ncbi:MAG TPA: hypothetical protein VJX67_12570 [Blastocatellia bacterium]|nr:hypothetical protein [Blastocatellia bacterium]